MLQPLEEQFQAEMGARLNPRQLPPEGNILPTGEQLPPSTTPIRPSYTDALSSSLGGQVQGGQAVLDFFGGALGGLADTGKRLAQDLLPPYSLEPQSFDPWFNPEGTAASLGRGFITETTAGYGEGPWEQQRSPADAALTMADAFDPTNLGGDALRGLVKSGKVLFGEGSETLGAAAGIIPSFKQQQKLKGTIVTETGEVGGTPLRVYHGSQVPIHEFKMGYEEQGLAGPGLYFTTDPDVAGGYTRTTYFAPEQRPGEYRDYAELIDPTTGQTAPAPTTHPAYLNLKKIYDWDKELDVDVVNNWIKNELTDKVPNPNRNYGRHIGDIRPSNRLKFILKDEANELIDALDSEMADEYNDFAGWFNGNVPFDSSYTSQLPGLAGGDFVKFVSELEELGVTRQQLNDILDSGGLKTMKIGPEGFTNIHGQQVIPPHSKFKYTPKFKDQAWYESNPENYNLASRSQLVVGHGGKGYIDEYRTLEAIRQTDTFKRWVPNEVPLGKEGTLEWPWLDHYQALVNKMDNIVWDDTNKVWRGNTADLIPDELRRKGYDENNEMLPVLKNALEDINNYPVVDFDFGKEFKDVVDTYAAGYTGEIYTNENWYHIMNDIYPYMDNPNQLANKSRTNNFLSREGFQGITHIGGGRTRGVEHQAYIVFPDLADAPFGGSNPFGFQSGQNPWTGSPLFSDPRYKEGVQGGGIDVPFPKGYGGRIFPEWTQLEGEVPQPITSDMIEMLRQTGKR